MPRRVVVTGMGAVTPVGKSVGSFWESLCSATSGIGPITSFDVSQYPTRIAGEVKDFSVDAIVEPKEARRTDRVILFSLAAAHEAVAHARLDMNAVDPLRCGTIIGSGIGGLTTYEVEHEKLLHRGPGRVSPFLIPMLISDMSAGRVSMQYGLKGPNYAVVSACASGAHALGDAFMAIKAGMMDLCVAGGSEAVVCPTALAGFCNMKALSTRNDTPAKASSPFDKKRDGFVMGEGSGIIVLEEHDHAVARGATILAELVGYGATGDAFHLSQPAPEGEGMARAMRMALSCAGLEPHEIQYINAHGTSTHFNDMFESMAIGTVFGEHASSLNISSTKSMTGHLLGASGAIELIASVMAVREGVIPPTINYEDPDPDCPLTYTPNTAVHRQVTCALSNSFGFGGHNASLIVRSYESLHSNG